MARFLQATLNDGSTVISEFSKLARVGRYISSVLSGARFNIWRVLDGAHPASGEPVKYRTREIVIGTSIAKIGEVQPKSGFETSHGYLSTNFEPKRLAVKNVMPNPLGTWRGDAAVAGAKDGAQYPVHREDGGQLRRFVFLDYAGGVKHFLDAESGIEAEESESGISGADSREVDDDLDNDDES